MDYLVNNTITNDCGITFLFESNGKSIELIPKGSSVYVNDENKLEFVRLVIEHISVKEIKFNSRHSKKDFSHLFHHKHYHILSLKI